MRERDALHRFLFEHHAVRGEIVHLDSTWRSVLERRDYPPAVRRILGEAMAASALLFATVKLDGQLTLQLQGKGPLHLLVVQCGGGGLLRGLARWRGDVSEQSLPALCGDGTLTVTIDPGSDRDRYQGIVTLAGESLTDAIELYFSQSEQLPTRLHLVADERSAAGLLLQRLPGASPDPEAWNRIGYLGASLTDPELLTLDATSILHRLFHQDDIRLFRSQPLSFDCSCSRERTARMLFGLGREEVDGIVEERGAVDVQCQFCGMNYHFDAVDVAGLFSGTVQRDPPATRH